MKEPVHFTKMHGAGNDFVVLEDAEGFFFGGDGADALARALCSAHTGIGSDGLIALRRGGEGADFEMAFRNPDGARVGMCGNGARCAAYFAFLKGWTGRSMRFASDAGTIGAEIVSDDPALGLATVKIETTEIRGRRDAVSLAAFPGRTYRFLDSGVPHAVRFAGPGDGDFDSADIRAEGRAVRFAPEFAPAGTNFDFARIDGPSSLSLRTYERGVEDETGACGTGAIAAAVAAAESGLVCLPCEVRVRSGDVLRIDAATGPDGRRSSPTLAGPARVVFEGTADAARFA